MTDIYAVIGKPVLHSKSPQMHNAAFAKLGMDAIYTRLAAESAAGGLETAMEIGIKGMNITAPFKEEMFGLVKCDEIAERIGAVNTVLLDVDGNGTASGTNTDVAGIVMALGNAKLKGKKAIVLGAGGAAKAAVVALQSLGATVVVMNRTGEKAIMIANLLGCEQCSIADAKKALDGADAIVSTVSTDKRIVDPKLLRRGMTILDAKYATETALMKDGRQRGCNVIDGSEWLLYQGAKAFEIFTGKKAPIEAMRKTLSKPEAGNTDPKLGTRNPKRNISLIGMMGSGKTTTAKELTKIKKMGLCELDEMIEKKTGKSIGQIFEEDGEKRFRKLEQNEINKLSTLNSKIISCGGGAILNEGNRRVLSENSLVIWLWADAKTMANRLKGDDTRPLANNNEQKEATLRTILETRKQIYVKACDMIVDSSKSSQEEVARRIDYESNAI